MNKLAITTANTAFTRSSRKKMIKRNRILARPPTIESARVPMDWAL